MKGVPVTSASAGLDTNANSWPPPQTYSFRNTRGRLSLLMYSAGAQTEENPDLEAEDPDLTTTITD